MSVPEHEQRSPEQERSIRRLTVMLFILLGVCALAYFTVSQQDAADRAELAMIMGSDLADSIVEVGRDGSSQLQSMAWEISKAVRMGAREAALDPVDLSRIGDLVREARAAATFEGRRQALESIAAIVERRDRPAQ